MAQTAEQLAARNVRAFTIFRMFFSARFYYPVFALIFLDFGLTLEQFGLLNAFWALTIVLCEVPSGALADTIGRRNLLITTGICMVLEMAVLLVAPIGGGTWLFVLFLLNRLISGFAEAAASGSDEALTYDSLKAAGQESRWECVLERAHRDTSFAFFIAMMTGAAVYDPDLANAVFGFFGYETAFERADMVKIPIFLTFLSGLVVTAMAFRMHEAVEQQHANVRATVVASWQNTLAAGRWIWRTAFPFGVILGVMALDSVIRQFLTLASEYWKVIDLPIATYGLIGSGMALVGMVVPRFARKMVERNTPVYNFCFLCVLVFAGSWGLGLALPYWGIVPAVLLYAAMHFMYFFVSTYLNREAPSEQRATVLSFKGLSTNFAYGVVSILYALLVAQLRLQAEGEAIELNEPVFIESLQWFPGYFAVCVVLILVVQRLRFPPKAQ